MPNIINLSKGAFLRLNSAGKSVAVKGGKGWATTEGRADDLILGPGTVLPEGNWLIEALDNDLILSLGQETLTLLQGGARHKIIPIYKQQRRAIF